MPASRVKRRLGSERDRLREAILSGHPFGSRFRERWHLGGKSGVLRAGVFGVSDGLVSNLALILGVAGAGVSPRAIVIAGIAGLLAGALSMAAGEYISMRVQREAFEYALRVEELEIELKPEAEEHELAEILKRKGFPSELAHEAASILMLEHSRALDAHAREELGLDPDDLGSPFGAAGSSLLTFAVGAAIPLLPFLLASGTGAAASALALGGASLAAVGGFMARMTGRPAWLGAARMSFLGVAAAAATYTIGRLVGVAIF
jgi:VIT1/CCC1 family predicted Fe2+/Mn2+ transporter